MRSSNFKFGWCSPAIVALLLTAGAVRAESYKIKISRPDKVGDEYTDTVTATFSQSGRVTINGTEEPAKADKFKAECRGTVKVLAINEKTGLATKVRYAVDQMTRDGDECYPQGTVIIAERGAHETTYDIDGERPDADHTAVLDAVINVNSPTDEYSDDQTTGTDKPQAVGGAWPIDTEKNAKMLAEDDIPIDAANLKGVSKLLEVKPVEGTDAMVITTTMTAAKLKKDLPQGGSITDGNAAITATETLPLDTSLHPLVTTLKMSIDVTIQLPQGVGTSTMKIKREFKEVRGPGPKP